VDAGFDPATQTSYLASASTGLNIPLGEAAILRYSDDVNPTASVPVVATAAQTAGEHLTFMAQAGKTYTFTKYVAVLTGRDSQHPEADARYEVQQATSIGAGALAAENTAAWSKLWSGDIVVDGDPSLQAAVHATEYSLWASIGTGSPGSIGPTGLSGEGYGGLVFWDADTWMYPALLAQHPDLARALLDYRYQTLTAARRNAAEYGLTGAFYSWTSAYDGDIATNCYGVVMVTGRPIADTNKSCTEELHLQGDIALSQWQYYEATANRTWLAQRGWPVLEGIAQFWASRGTPGPNGSYSINDVQPPDENATGVDNSAYTNAVAALALEHASQAARLLGNRAPAQWERTAQGLARTMPLDARKHIYLEYDGYNGSTIKQADVVMLTYPLQFPMPPAVAANDVNYYAPRTSPSGPAMTDAIHSIDVSALNVPGCSAYTYLLRAYTPFVRAPFLQFSETRDDTIAGVPVAAFDFLTGAGGFLQTLLYGYSGLRFGLDSVYLDPTLSPQLKGLTLRNLQWQGRTFTIQLRPRTTTITLAGGRSLPIRTPAGAQLLRRGTPIKLRTRRPDLQPTADLARCRPAAASSSVDGNEPVAAVDGSTATSWTATSPQATLTVDLQRTTAVRQLNIQNGNTGQFAYNVQASVDGSHWYPIASVAASSASTHDITIRPRRARFIRLSFPGGGTAGAPSIAELSVIGHTLGG
jgi:trehalose/maltose hydrolase-like predicted phosphorylase